MPDSVRPAPSQDPPKQEASPSPEVILRLVGLTKRFGGHKAVEGLDLDVRRGEVLGFLGPNGAGKTTTVGMILGLIAPTAGRVEYTGVPLKRIGAIIEGPAFYPYLSGRDNLRALALAAGGIELERDRCTPRVRRSGG